MSSFRIISGLSILGAAMLPLSAAVAAQTTSDTNNPAAAAAPNAAQTRATSGRQDSVGMTSTDPADVTAGAAAGASLQTSGTPAELSYTLKAGDPHVMTNGPIPDTPENREKYGLPNSRAGRHSEPIGN